MLEGTKSWLNQTVSLESVTGVDGYSDPTYGTSSDVDCRIVEEQKEILSDTGEVQISNTQIYVDGSETVNLSDRLTLPGNETPEILSIKTIYAPDGTAYMKVIYT